MRRQKQRKRSTQRTKQIENFHGTIGRENEGERARGRRRRVKPSVQCLRPLSKRINKKLKSDIKCTTNNNNNNNKYNEAAKEQRRTLEMNTTAEGTAAGAATVHALRKISEHEEYIE